MKRVTINQRLKHRILSIYNYKCIECGRTNLDVPLEVDHINGDSEDNKESNLRLICPNCHSLSPNFRNLNKGKGRSWRKAKYIKN